MELVLFSLAVVSFTGKSFLHLGSKVRASFRLSLETNWTKASEVTILFILSTKIQNMKLSANMNSIVDHIYFVNVIWLMYICSVEFI